MPRKRLQDVVLLMEKEQNSRLKAMASALTIWRTTSWILALMLIGLITWSLVTGVTPERLSYFVQNPNEISVLVDRIQNDKKFNQTKKEIDQLIDSNYVGQRSDTDLYRTSLLKGYVNALQDKYSEYLTRTDYEEITNSLNASFTGIGISFEYFEGYVEVQQVFPDTPAQKAGLAIGDKITDVDGIGVSNFGSSDLVRSKITGPEDTEVKLNYVRGGESKEVRITRKKISFPLITLEKKTNVAVLHISSFGLSIDSEMAKYAKEIRNDTSIKYIVLDLLNNGGGYLNSAIDLVSYFVEPGSTVVIDKTKQKEEILKSTSKINSLKEYPLVVTGNRYTASASEITIGALQDLRKTTFIGTKTYGKGVVQQIFPLTSGDALKLTIAEWYTPSRRAINKTGLMPDIVVEKDEIKTILERFSWEENKLK